MRRAMEFTASVWALGVMLSGQALAQDVSGPEHGGSIQTSGMSDAGQKSPVAPASGDGLGSSGEGLGEIVVTARRTSENLQSVPVSITAFTGEQLKQQSARSISDVALLTPGLQINYSTSINSAALFTIRGQVAQDPIANQDPSVGVYVDGLYWARSYGANVDLLDIQAVQVLKGPQGTLFGRNTTGGAILLSTNDPRFNDGLSGQASLSYGRFNYRALTGVLNAPLIEDKLAFRVAAQLIKRDGYIREINSGRDLGNINNYTIRSKLLFQPTESLKVLLSGEWFSSNTLTEPQRLIYASPTSLSAISTVAETDGFATAGALGCFDPGGVGAACQARASALFNDTIAKSRGNNADLGSVTRSDVKTQTYSATATLETSFGAVKAIGGYRKVHSFGLNDADGSRFELLDGGPSLNEPGLFTQDATLSQYSVEVVATGKALNNQLDFATGVYYFHETGSDGSQSKVINAINPVGFRFLGTIKNTSKSVFGQATYHANSALSFTGGLRYTVDDKQLSSFNQTFSLSPLGPDNFTCILALVCPASRQNTFKGLSYTAGVDYKIRDHIFIYAKIAKGFRSGGQNIRATTSGAFLPFKPENATSYESGIKSEFLDRRLRINLAGYYTVLKDIQRTISVVTSTGAVATAITNAGQADVFGGEFEASAALPGGFRLDGTLGYTHPKYVKFIDNGFDRSRDAFYGVPKWTASISPSWTGDLDFGKLLLRADFSYQSDMNISPVAFYTDGAGVLRDAQSGAPVAPVDAAGYLRGATDRAHWLINARAGIAVMDGKLDLTVWGRNLTDKRDYVAGLTLPSLGFSAAGLREPRTFGVTATMKLGAP